ncbi:glucosaminidase domain-containing protein [Sulfurimonas sp. HSL3-7]|uniref:glucosaminidase domain-containing protein n=1 Tax=Sulfonitrofixus jiaomeiensis TaxID=3131938 RepID=UPI0031F8CC6B
MKQIVLAVIALLLLASMYAVYNELNKIIPFFDQNSSKTVEDSDTDVAHNSSGKKTATSNTERKRYKTPASTPESKRLFLKKTIAAIRKVKARLDAEYQAVYELSLKEKLTPKEQAKIERLKKRYKVSGFPCLLKRMHTHPISIVIAQAALESGWGSSRFYREANNIFGVWSFNPNEPRIAAGIPREGQKTIYVKKYKNLEASIESYYRMMARGRAFEQFRTARLHTNNPFEIIAYLDHYSELRHEYVKRLYYVIKSNRFNELDTPVYQPPGWKNIEPARAEYLIPEKEEPAAKVADKCKKDITPALENSERNSSRVPDITVLPKKAKESATVTHITNVPHSHDKVQDRNNTKEQNRSKDVPIKVQEVNTAEV